MSTIGIIVARGGSKGLPRKNILDCAGRPLIEWTVQAAKKAKNLDSFFLSTDDTEIAECARNAGCEVPFIRPEELARDDSTIGDVINHSLEFLSNLGRSYENILLLQATSPLRTADHIDSAIQLFKKSNAQTLVSVYEAPSKAAWLLKENEGRIEFVINEYLQQRQALPRLYYPNGAIYISKVKNFNSQFYTEDTIPFVMKPEFSIDVDTEKDLELAIQYLRNR